MNSKLIQEAKGIVAVLDERIMDLKQAKFTKYIPMIEKAKSLVEEVVKGMEAE